MKKEKIIAASNILNRDFYLDYFATSENAPFLIMYYGGSGVDRDKYVERSKTIIPIFDQYFFQLKQELDFSFCYISSPPDINIIKFENSGDEVERWFEHIESEVMPLLPDLPFYFIGYSGGIALATCGIHLSDRCFGGGALGGDQLPDDLETGCFWKEPLALYYNLSDLVYQKNESVINELQADEIVYCYRRLPGTHNIQDYLVNESFSGQIRRAGRLFADSAKKNFTGS
ncbi:hypothetical protein [Desulfobacter latus]|uniref:Alpha/beta hydrolase n=1 Tax=Desulfobacter latus TaxID=2292 RepID=A0A850T9E4_9BACT|nr:hypothetical protein [Desulfobacter latus]NWH04817.1 hypothetical protein [Desulfobacter latus]